MNLANWITLARFPLLILLVLMIFFGGVTGRFLAAPGVLLLIVTALPGMGITKKGATRWLDVGIVVQPSEILKIAMPLIWSVH